MRQILTTAILLCAFLLPGRNAVAQTPSVVPSRSARSYASAPQRPAGMPESVYCEALRNHVQGLAVDLGKGCMYFSFTTSFIKTDLRGRVLGTIDRIQGHLGAMTLNPDDGCVYASLECKDDAIGQGIAKGLGVSVTSQNAFYVAIIDVDRVNRIGMDPERDPVLRTVCITDACEDYAARMVNDGRSFEHRYGCSGIDGITYGPKIGSKGGRNRIYVAYGIYGDVDRTDNDYQVILCYDPVKLKRMSQPMSFGILHNVGPRRPQQRYYIYTGNTEWGVQNLMYDPFTREIFMAVYNGRKPGFANFKLMSFSVDQKPFKAPLTGCGYDMQKKSQLVTSDMGMRDPRTGLCGWFFKYGSTGMTSLGGGYYIFSENGKNQKGNQCTNARLYRWTGDPMSPFAPVIR